jgi:hypothetical protein
VADESTFFALPESWQESYSPGTVGMLGMSLD